MRIPNYGYETFYSPEDGEYVALCREVAGLSGLAASPGEAIAELQVALGGWLEYLADKRVPAPLPFHERPDAEVIALFGLEIAGPARTRPTTRSEAEYRSEAEFSPTQMAASED